MGLPGRQRIGPLAHWEATAATLAGDKKMAETTYWQRTDSFDEKMRLLNEAYRRKDYRLARSIADSLRHSLTLEQQQQAPLGEDVLPATGDISVSALPASWRDWAIRCNTSAVSQSDHCGWATCRRAPIELFAGRR